ncbi:hypothetical protein GCM10009714_01560 [Microlunatus capsulatus]
MLDFWRWSSSDLLGNAMRGVLAEFIVGTALDCIVGTVREEWDAADLKTSEGVRIEVKSSAYVQSWHQTKAFNPVFGIQPTLGWDADTNLTSERRRQADVYVFCLLHHRDKLSADPLDVSQWTFLVLSTERLNEVFDQQKSVTLGSLRSRAHPAEVSYDGLRAGVEAATTAQGPTTVR